MVNRRENLIVDVAALVVYLVVANPTITGVPVHEWLGLGVLAVLLVHCAAHGDWVVEMFRSFGRSSWGARGHLVLDALILVAFLTVVVSGVGISGAVLPTFGLFADGYYFWNPLHAIAAKALLASLLVHIAVHWKWLYGCFAKRKGGEDGENTV